MKIKFILWLILALSLGCSSSKNIKFNTQQINADDIIDALNNNQPIFLNNKNIVGVLDFTKLKNQYYQQKNIAKVIVNQPVSFINCTFNDSVKAYATNSKNNEFTCSFNINLCMEGCTFKKPVIFRRSAIHGNATFTGSKFEEEAFFEGIDFYGYTLFNETNFSKPVMFNECKFNDYANFFKVFFKETASFQNCVFNDVFKPANGNFYGYTDFSGCKFFGFTDFAYTTFYKQAIFANQIYMFPVKFTGVVFNFSVEFKDIIFMNNTNFSNISFNDKTLFSNILFALDKPDFSESSTPVKSAVIFENIRLLQTENISKSININSKN